MVTGTAVVGLPHDGVQPQAMRFAGELAVRPSVALSARCAAWNASRGRQPRRDGETCLLSISCMCITRAVLEYSGAKVYLKRSS